MTDQEQCKRVYGLNTHTLYRVPPVNTYALFAASFGALSVSYSGPTNARGFWTGRTRQLPVGGGMMAEFDLGERGTWWLRPFGVVKA